MITVSDHPHPHIRVIYEVKEIPATCGMKVIYNCVEIVRQKGQLIRYTSGDYETDLAADRSDGRILTNLQEHSSVAAYQKLIAAKPEERYKLIMKGDVVPPS